METKIFTFTRELLTGAGFAMIALVPSANAAINCVAPPTLSNPIVYDGKCPADAGFPDNVKAGGRDVLIKLPTTKTCSKGLSVSGARNVRITGGHFVYADTKSAVITVHTTTGTIFLDGLLIDVNKRGADAIRTYNPGTSAKLIVQNVFARGISGTPTGVHGDLVHPQGGSAALAELILQNVTGLTGYQGLFTPLRVGSNMHGTHKLRLDRVNVGYDPNLSKSSGAGKPLKLIYIGSADNSTDRVPDLGTTMTNVYADTSYWNIAYNKSIYAEPTPGTNGCATFASKHKVTGQICNGKPSTGDFAPASRVGRSYNRAYFCN